jgi:5-methylcytosine-specific restriction endonuclease McrA
MEKTCSQCHTTKPVTEFNKQRSQKDGLRPYCTLCHRAMSQAWYQQHPQEAKQYRAAWYQRNRLKVIERAAAYKMQLKEQDPEKETTRLRNWQRMNVVKVKQRNKQWKTHNPDKRQDQGQRRRARQRHAPRIDKVDRRAIIERDQSICHLCGKKVSPPEMSLDHLIPLFHHGEHTARNLAVAHISCNSQRGTGRLPAQLRLW